MIRVLEPQFVVGTFCGRVDCRLLTVFILLVCELVSVRAGGLPRSPAVQLGNSGKSHGLLPLIRYLGLPLRQHEPLLKSDEDLVY